LLEIEYPFAHFDEKLVVVVHLLDDFYKVGDELLFDTTMTCMVAEIPNTDPIAEILLAALSLREGLSLLSSSI